MMKDVYFLKKKNQQNGKLRVLIWKLEVFLLTFRKCEEESATLRID